MGQAWTLSKRREDREMALQKLCTHLEHVEVLGLVRIPTSLAYPVLLTTAGVPCPEAAAEDMQHGWQACDCDQGCRHHDR